MIYALFVQRDANSTGIVSSISVRPRPPLNFENIPQKIIIQLENKQKAGLATDDTRDDLSISCNLASKVVLAASRNELKEDLPQVVQIKFDHISSSNINGSSAGVALALASIESLCHFEFGQVAVTGALGSEFGIVEEVKYIANKISGFCDFVENTKNQNISDTTPILLLYPKSNEMDTELSEILKRRTQQLGIQLACVSTVIDALSLISETSASIPFSVPSSLDSLPFRGLNSFNFDDRWCYYGRRSEAKIIYDKFVEQIKSCNIDNEKKLFLTIEGTSGAGKSSFIKAGILPKIVFGHNTPEVKQWYWTTTKTSYSDTDCFTSLANAILSDSHTIGPNSLQSAINSNEINIDILTDAFRNDLKNAHKILIDLLVKAHNFANQVILNSYSGLIIVIDQFEELFSQADKKQQENYLNLLIELSTFHTVPIVIMITLRSDYLSEIERFPDFISLIKDTTDNKKEVGITYYLKRLSTGHLREIIEIPLNMSNLYFSQTETGENQIELLIRDAIELNEFHNALPFIQFLLTERYEDIKNNTEQKQLNYNDGELKLVIQNRADKAIQSLSFSEKEKNRLLEILFYCLIGMNRRGESLFVRNANYSDVCKDSQLNDIVNSLIDAYILTREYNEDKKYSSLRFSHSAILTSWSNITEWLNSSKPKLKLRDRLELDANEWEKDEYPLIPEGSLLEEAEDIYSTVPNLSDQLNAYIEKSLQAKEEKLRAEENKLRTEEEKKKLNIRNIRNKNRLIIGVSVFSIISLGLYLIDRSNLTDKIEGTQEDFNQIQNTGNTLGVEKYASHLVEISQLHLDSNPEISLYLSEHASKISPSRKTFDILRQSFLSILNKKDPDRAIKYDKLDYLWKINNEEWEIYITKILILVKKNRLPLGIIYPTKSQLKHRFRIKVDIQDFEFFNQLDSIRLAWVTLRDVTVLDYFDDTLSCDPYTFIIPTVGPNPFSQKICEKTKNLYQDVLEKIRTNGPGPESLEAVATARIDLKTIMDELNDF